MSTNPHPNARDTRSLTEVLRDLRDETFLLLKQETALLKGELNEKLFPTVQTRKQLVFSAAVANGGIIFGLYAANQFLDAQLPAWGIAPTIAAWLAPLSISLVASTLGYLLVTTAVQVRR